jgi:hypothetical protein
MQIFKKMTSPSTSTFTQKDLTHLRRTIALAEEALIAGDAPFGSVLVDRHGLYLHEDRNRISSMGDDTRHPEFELARWAAANMRPEDRRTATVYTSGEHCAMWYAEHSLSSCLPSRFDVRRAFTLGAACSPKRWGSCVMPGLCVSKDRTAWIIP